MGSKYGLAKTVIESEEIFVEERTEARENSTFNKAETSTRMQTVSDDRNFFLDSVHSRVLVCFCSRSSGGHREASSCIARGSPCQSERNL